MKIITMSLTLLAILAACSTEDKDENKGVIPQHQKDAMEKARDVEDVLQQTDDKRRKEADE